MYPNGTSDYITKMILTVFASFFCKQFLKEMQLKYGLCLYQVLVF